MKAMPLSPDDALLSRLTAPPDLREGTEALAYWRGRRGRLPWYRFAARREAARMTAVWETRVRAALIRQRGVPVAARVHAGKLVAATWLRRISSRLALAFAIATFVFVVVPAAIVLDLLLRAL